MTPDIEETTRFAIDPVPPFFSKIDAQAAAAFVNGALDEPFLEGILLGRCGGQAEFRVARAWRRNRLVGTAWLGWGSSFPRMAVLAGVVTDRACRRQGIASRACTMVCEAFERSGGSAVYLGAAHAGAQQVYERLGFELHVGRIMRRIVPGQCDVEALQPTPPFTHRSADYSDMARILLLYQQVRQCLAVDTGIRYASVTVEPPYRCVGVFWQTWASSIGAGGQWFVLEDANGMLVASATVRPAGERLGVEFIWRTDCDDAGMDFLRSVTTRAESRFGRPCELILCEDDTWKADRATRLGFCHPRPTGRTMEAGDRAFPILAFSRRK